GSVLLNIQPAGINATPNNVAGSVVLRDSFGGFNAGAISGKFLGDGSGLLNIQPAGINATSNNVAGSVVQRDDQGGFNAGNIQVQNNLLSLGLADFTGASHTLPVKAVLMADTPTTCQGSKEVLIKTDAAPGQQL